MKPKPALTKRAAVKSKPTLTKKRLKQIERELTKKVVHNDPSFALVLTGIRMMAEKVRRELAE